MNAIGIMQGRLSPAGPRPQAFPAASWRDEFEIASRLGFACIEWLVTAGSVGENPLLQADAAQVRAIVRETGVTVESVCADCFIERPLVRGTDGDRDAAIALLMRLVEQSASAGIRAIVVPLLETNAVADAAECAELLHRLDATLARADELGITIALETDLPPAELHRAIDTTGAGVCYDLGNAAAAGLDTTSALEILGGRVVAVHVKDRRRGASVPLGDGDVDFQTAFAGLRSIGYAGPVILETPRGHSPIDAARDHLAFVRRLLAQPVQSGRPASAMLKIGT